MDKDGKAVEGAEFFVDGDYKLPQGQSYVTGKNGNFSFKAFENAKMIVIWKKDGKMMGVPATVNKENNSNMKIVMDREWQNPPADDPDNPVFEVVETMPEFPNGGMGAMMEFLSKNIRYPVNAQKNGTQGRVTVQFIVNTDGSISNIGILREVDPELDGEAVRVISAMPKWKPGMQKGKPVRVKYTVPVMFRLNDDAVPKEDYKPIEKVDEMVVVGYAPKEESPVNEDVVFVNPEKPDVPLNKNDAFQKVQKRRVQEKR